jgi:hypothetical protein
MLTSLDLLIRRDFK